jgi:tetratricopeptide (TPR) repeat protein
MNFRYGGKDADLLKNLEERIEKNPSSSFFAMLSYLYLDVGKIAEALSIAQRGVIAHPNYSTGHVVLAMAMMKAKLFYDARKELAKAGDLKPGSKIVESLTKALDKDEQADEIGKKLADQFHKNRPGGKDLMKTIEETIEAYRPKGASDDFIIPGLDAIIGGEPGKIAPQLKPPTIIPSKPEASPGYSDSGQNKEGPSRETAKGEAGSIIAKAIIEKVTREVESNSSSLREKQVESPDSTGDDLQTQITSSASSDTGDAILPVYEPDEAESTGGDFDLDALAHELEAAGPIKPLDDQVRDRSDESGIELTPEIVTETLARIFEQQGQLKTAIEAYNVLIQKKPEQAEIYKKKIAELTQKTNG